MSRKKAPAAGRSVKLNHNESLTEEQRIALFFIHVKEYGKALEAKKQADADFKNKCKAIKAEGSEIADIKLAALEPKKFDDYIKNTAQAFIRLAQWLGSPLGSQLKLFDDGHQPPEDERAFAAGKRAGLQGDDADPPYAKHLPQAQSWLKGWQEGQSVLFDLIKERQRLAELADKEDEEDDDDYGEEAA